MPWVGFELTIPVFERAKMVHALDRAATVIGPVFLYTNHNIFRRYMIRVVETIIKSSIN
jgi:hypothetical protein